MGHGKQVNSGTLIFRRTENARKVLLAWVEEQKFQTQKMLQGAYSKPYREAWDQQTLQERFGAAQGGGAGLALAVLQYPPKGCRDDSIGHRDYSVSG